MINNKKIQLQSKLIFAFLVLLIPIANAINPPDTTDYFDNNFIRNDNHTYVKNIKSIEMYRVGFELSDPAITLNSDEKFYVSFDELNSGVKQYYFTVFHCDASWRKSEIWANEYLQSADEEQIQQFNPSFSTRTPYMHYSFEFPNDKLIITKSGNYILKVYTRNSAGEEVPVFTRRFLVIDQKVNINASALRSATSEFYETHQEVDFSISTSGLRIDSPYQDIKVVVLQNGRWDNALTTLKPYMVRNDVLDYNFDNESNVFEGGNEFRHFDIKSLKFLSDRIRAISFDDTMNYVKLWETEKRTYKSYVSDEDINGKFLLKTDDESDVATMGEYCIVKFFLAFDAPIVEGNLYVVGGFNGWAYSSENKMTYNYRRKGYEASILFKQGYYNYLFTLLPNTSIVGDVGYIEGNHSMTQNTYTVLVYHRQRGELYDELIGIKTFESGNR